MEHSAGKIVLLQACGTGHIKMILEAGRLNEDGRRAHGFEAVVERGGERADDETKFVLRTDIFGGGAKNARGAQHHDSGERNGEGEAGRYRETYEENGRALHGSFGRDREL